MDSMYQQLLQLPLFQGVSVDKISALVAKLPFHFLKYRNGEQVFAVGEPCTHIKFIVSGKVRLETPFPHLRVSMFQSLETPNVLAAEYFFGRETNYPFAAVAEGQCGILQLRKGDYLKMINDDKVFLFNILNYLSSGSQRATASTINVKDGTVGERLSTLIDSLTISGAQDIELRYKQKDLCTLLGTQRVTLIATLERLSDKGILEYDNNHLTVLDFARMINE